jgi:hypothetical protein
VLLNGSVNKNFVLPLQPSGTCHSARFENGEKKAHQKQLASLLKATTIIVSLPTQIQTPFWQTPTLTALKALDAVLAFRAMFTS